MLVVAAMAVATLGAASPSSANAKLVTCTRYFLAIHEFETLATCWAGMPEVFFGKWERKELAKGQSVQITSSGGTFTLTATVGGVPIEIKCEKEKDSSELVGGEPITGTTTMEFTTCSAGACKVKEPIKIEKAKVEVVTEGEKFFYKLSPSSGTVFTTIVLEGCGSKGTYELTGTARSEIGAETSTFGSGTGSKLTLKKGESSGAATLLGKVTEAMTSKEEGVEEVRFAFEK
jgi:hypothetical protein